MEPFKFSIYYFLFSILSSSVVAQTGRCYHTIENRKSKIKNDKPSFLSRERRLFYFALVSNWRENGGAKATGFAGFGCDREG
jgi:hypothetical protein